MSLTYTEVAVQDEFISTTETTTNTVLGLLISTSSVYPVPDNVTVVFADTNGPYTYIITAGSSITSGSTSGSDAFQLSQLFQGELITVELATGSALPENGFSYGSGNYATMQVYLNGQLVAHASKTCTGSGYAIMTYTI